MSNPRVEAGNSCLRQPSSCLDGGWKDSGGYSSRKVTLKIDPESTVSREKDIELQSDIEIELFSKQIIHRTIDKMYGGKINLDLRNKLEEFKQDLDVFDNTLADLVGCKLRPYRITMTPNEENGAKYKDAMKKAIDTVINDIKDTHEESVVNGLTSVSNDIQGLPACFFSLMLQRIDEGRQNLPAEDSFFVNPELIAKYPEKYQIQRIGMQVSQWLFAVGVVAAGSYRPDSRGVLLLDKGDAGDLFSSLIGIATNRLNITKDQAVARILSQPDFVSSLHNGSEPKLDGSILGSFDASAALYMSALALANKYHLSEYAGMSTAMVLVRIKRAIFSLPQCFSRVFYHHVGR